MATVSLLTKKCLEQSFLLKEYLEEGIINYIALANRFKPFIEKEMGKPVKASAIAMALRRHCKETESASLQIPSFKDSEVIIKGALCDIGVYKSLSLFECLKSIHNLIDYSKGDSLNVIHGNYDISIIINERFKDEVMSILKDEKVFNVEDNLVALTARIGKHFIYTPGITFLLLKQLVLKKINLIEIVSSLNEITFIISKKDASSGYNCLQEFLEKESNGAAKALQ